MRKNEEIKEIIKDVMGSFGIKIEKILLFGSRARGNNTGLSDYDILVLINKTISIQEKIELSSLIRKKTAGRKIDTDIIIKSAEEAEISKKQIGALAREALREGVPL